MPQTVHWPAPPRSSRTLLSSWASGVVEPWSAQPMVSRRHRRAIRTTSSGSRSKLRAAIQRAKDSDSVGPGEPLLAVTHPHLVPARVRREALEDALNAAAREVRIGVLEERDAGKVAGQLLDGGGIVAGALGLGGGGGGLAEELVHLRVAVAGHVGEGYRPDVVAHVDARHAHRGVTIGRVVVDVDVDVEVVLLVDLVEHERALHGHLLRIDAHGPELLRDHLGGLV